jgi:16S rRNA (cytosine1402-N4)-methyltransferase
MTEADPSGPRHVAVMPAEVLHWLAPSPGQVLVDATAGAGGHSLLLAKAVAPTGRIIALDRDPAMLKLARKRTEGLPVTLAEASFDQLRQVLDDLRIDAVDGVLADLGLCSDQLDDAGRGFSFQQEGPLDMRMNHHVGEPAANLLKHLNERELADVFYHHGEERHSRRIARRIVEVRQRQPLETTTQLAELVRRCVPMAGGKRQRIDPATRVFQALRIAVNDELAALEGLLAALPRCLKPGGRAVLISFHSLEDRRVKQAFRERDVWEVLTKKPIEATEEEVRHNPRARSAKLRAARRMDDVHGRTSTQSGSRPETVQPDASGDGPG